MIALKGPMPCLGGVDPELVVPGGVLQPPGPVVVQPAGGPWAARRPGAGRFFPMAVRMAWNPGGSPGGVVVAVQIAVKVQNILLPMRGSIPKGCQMKVRQ